MKITITLALLILVLLFNLAASQAPRPTWEYKVENGISEAKINSLSAQGWEVVTAGQYNGGMPYVILGRPR